MKARFNVQRCTSRMFINSCTHIYNVMLYCIWLERKKKLFAKNCLFCGFHEQLSLMILSGKLAALLIELLLELKMMKYQLSDCGIILYVFVNITPGLYIQ